MNAGRELDKIIAFNVMGYETYSDGQCDCANDRPLGPQCGYQMDRKLGASPHTWVIPYFSVSMEDAWAVVVHLEHHENRYEWLLQEIGEQAIAGLKSSVFKLIPVAHKSNSMPLSICIAAAKAMNIPLIERPAEEKRIYTALEINKP